MELLRERKRQQMQHQLLAGEAWCNPWNLVFTHETGEHLCHYTVYRYFKTVVREMGRATSGFTIFVTASRWRRWNAGTTSRPCRRTLVTRRRASRWTSTVMCHSGCGRNRPAEWRSSSTRFHEQSKPSYKGLGASKKPRNRLVSGLSLAQWEGFEPDSENFCNPLSIKEQYCVQNLELLIPVSLFV